MVYTTITYDSCSCVDLESTCCLCSKLCVMGARSMLPVGQCYRFVLCLCIQCIDCAVVTLYNLIVRVHLLGVDVDGSTYPNVQFSQIVQLRCVDVQ